jgi:predicted O-methyltransferase YrrM
MRKNDEYYNIFAQETEELRNIRNKCPASLYKMQLSPLEGKTIQFLAKLIKPKKILELGTLVGYSACWLKNILDQDGILITVDKSISHLNIAKENLQDSRIQFIQADALDFLYNNNQVFDVIFIDGAKKDYYKYLPMVKKALNKNGLIIADNTNLFGLIHREDIIDKKLYDMWISIRQFNHNLVEDREFDTVFLNTYGGLTVAWKN